MSERKEPIIGVRVIQYIREVQVPVPTLDGGVYTAEHIEYVRHQFEWTTDGEHWNPIEVIYRTVE
jgi:hypothetical protein